MILVISTAGDWSADAVADQLAARAVPFARLDTRDFPQRIRLAAEVNPGWAATLETGEGVVNLSDVTAVYYRRPADFDMPPGLSAPELRFARAQARVGLGGVLASVPCRWINRPSALADAEYKPRQLAVAATVGFQVPATLITNDPAAVREFAAATGEVVVKPLAEPLLAEAGAYSLAYTRRLGPADLADLAGIDVTAHLIQQWIPKTHDVRVTVVGQRMFSVAIHAHSDAGRIDFRSDYDALTYEPIQTPAPIRAAISALLPAFGLVYGAFDFAVDHDSAWYFLEVNGAGQFGWLVEECDLPIPAAIAAELTTEVTP